jgi:predicted amidohydrolase
MKIALAQADIIWNEPRRNLDRYEKLLDRSLELGARLTALPEMFTTGFSLPTGALARHAYDAGFSFLEAFARERSTYLAASIPKLNSGALLPYNTLFIFGPEGLVGEYSKIHLISALGENATYQAGNKTLTVMIDDFRVSFFICYDLRFPGVFSEVAETTDLYVVVANWPSIRQQHWDVLLDARAIENQAYVAGVNRVGQGGGLHFAGGSKVVSPLGNTLQKAGTQEEIILTDIFVSEVSGWRSEFPCLKDRANAQNLSF